MSINSGFPVGSILTAGLVGELAFEAYAWLVSPSLFGTALEPANLVTGLTKAITGVTLSYPAAFTIHFLIGAVGFALFVYLVHIVTKRGLIMSGVIAGAVLWFVAQGILAPLMGRDFMMGFGSYTQSSAIAHVGMAALMGAVMQQLGVRKPDGIVTAT